MDLDLLEKDARAMQADLPYSAIINGQEIECTLCEINSKDREFLNNTKQLNTIKVLNFIINDLPNQEPLKIKSKLTYKGKVLRILDYKISMDEIEQRVILGNLNAS